MKNVFFNLLFMVVPLLRASQSDLVLLENLKNTCERFQEKICADDGFQRLVNKELWRFFGKNLISIGSIGMVNLVIQSSNLPDVIKMPVFVLAPVIVGAIYFNATKVFDGVDGAVALVKEDAASKRRVLAAVNRAIARIKDRNALHF